MGNSARKSTGDSLPCRVTDQGAGWAAGQDSGHGAGAGCSDKVGRGLGATGVFFFLFLFLYNP